MSNTSHAQQVCMRRAGPASVLECVEVLLDAPRSGEVQVAIEAAGVAYADIVIRRGLDGHRKPPLTPGYDFVGRIVRTGPDVDGLRVGDRVAGVTITGSYASHRNVDADLITPAPEGIDAAKLVAVVLNGLTAWQMLNRLMKLSPGDTVLVHGAAGGVGSLLLDFARISGLRAIGTSSAGKRAHVEARGAMSIDHAQADLVRRVRALSPAGVHAAFDPVGGSHLVRRTMPALAGTGVGVVYGGYGATRDGVVNPMAIADLFLGGCFSAFSLFRRSQGVLGYAIPEWLRERSASCRADLDTVLSLVARGAVDPLIAARLPLASAAEAHRMLESRAAAGKIVLIP